MIWKLIVIKSKKAEGTWSLEIWAECPHCKEDVDFTCSSDFWDGFKFETIGPVTDWACVCPNCNGDVLLNVEAGL
ncbi:hypothetical protein RG369_002408 [Acinetobacter baumannii]|nr:hypothetical protein [Acinetobacter baumannii]